MRAQEDKKFAEIMTLTGGLGFIKGYTKSAIENAAKYPASYSRERLIEILQTVSSKAEETFAERDKLAAEISQQVSA